MVADPMYRRSPFTGKTYGEMRDEELRRNVERSRTDVITTKRADGSEIILEYVKMWRLYGVTKDDEKTWLGKFDTEAEISGIANFFANNPHFEHMEIFEGPDFRYAVMRIIGGRND